MNKTIEKQTHRKREQTSGYHWGREKGNIRVRAKEAETNGCKIGSRM